MRLIPILLLLFTGSDTSAQVFNEELYSKYNSESNGVESGRVLSINDTLAIIDFLHSGYYNGQIVASYQFQNDSLVLTELDTLIELNRRVECTYSDWLNEKNVISIGYGPHYLSKGYMYFDTLTFEVNGVRHRAKIGTAVNYIRIERPLEEQFSVKIYDDSVFIDSFEGNLSEENNSILFDMDIIETSYSNYGSPTIFSASKESAKLIQERLPDFITIDNKEYNLIVHLLPKKNHLIVE